MIVGINSIDFCHIADIKLAFKFNRQSDRCWYFNLCPLIVCLNLFLPFCFFSTYLIFFPFHSQYSNGSEILVEHSFATCDQLFECVRVYSTRNRHSISFTLRLLVCTFTKEKTNSFGNETTEKAFFFWTFQVIQYGWHWIFVFSTYFSARHFQDQSTKQKLCIFHATKNEVLT